MQVPSTPSSSEQRINEAKDVVSILAAVQTHVRGRYRNAPYSAGKDHLANIVAVEVLRRLPGYAGTDCIVTPYDHSRGPLSHLVNVLAKSRNLDLIRKYNSQRAHQVLSCDLTPREDGQDPFTVLSDGLQSSPSPERALALSELLKALPPTQRPAVVRCISEGRVSDNERRTFNKVVARAERYGREGLSTSSVSGCVCWNCSPRQRPERRPGRGWFALHAK